MTYELRTARTLASLFTQLCQCKSVSPAILRFALGPQTSFTTSQLPGHPRLEPALAGITQRTKTPKALKEFKGEDDCCERQLEKDSGKVRRIKIESMAAPRRIIDT